MPMPAVQSLRKLPELGQPVFEFLLHLFRRIEKRAEIAKRHRFYVRKLYFFNFFDDLLVLGKICFEFSNNRHAVRDIKFHTHDTSQCFQRRHNLIPSEQVLLFSAFTFHEQLLLPRSG